MYQEHLGHVRGGSGVLWVWDGVILVAIERCLDGVLFRGNFFWM